MIFPASSSKTSGFSGTVVCKTQRAWTGDANRTLSYIPTKRPFETSALSGTNASKTVYKPVSR